MQLIFDTKFLFDILSAGLHAIVDKDLQVAVQQESTIHISSKKSTGAAVNGYIIYTLNLDFFKIGKHFSVRS